MISGLRVYALLIGVLAVAGGVCADTVSVYPGDVEGYQVIGLTGDPDIHSKMSPSLFDYQSVRDLRPEPIQYSATEVLEPGNAHSSQPSHILNDGQSSLSLCISAIIGLGLCSSAHCVRKLSFGFIPEWYHNGGPFQIGHSLAVEPDSVCPAPMCCLVQPATTTEDFIPQYHLGTIVSLWRKSQFTAVVLAGRGPPAGR